MNPGLVVKLRAAGPWRTGPDSGSRNRVDVVYHSDSLYSAVTAAMRPLGQLSEWIEATAGTPAEPAVRFSSCFPFMEDIGFIIPPRTVWPPPVAPMATPARVRWKTARFVPLGLIPGLLDGQMLDEEQWSVDGVSECLVPAGRPGPFRTSVRSSAAVDRLSGAVERHSIACLEFRPGAGMWAIVSFADATQRDRWIGPVRAAFRLLADSGFGGERSRGWGRAEEPEFVEGELPDLILPSQTPAPAVEVDVQPSQPMTAHWILSLFAPGGNDQVDWRRGNYSLVLRGGRIESPARYGELKKQIQMVAEGSVLLAGQTIRGAAINVAPDDFPHPVFRAGFALSIPIPEQVL